MMHPGFEFLLFAGASLLTGLWGLRILLEGRFSWKICPVTVCLALLLSACSSGPQNLILGKWELESGIKMTAEFRNDGTARMTMFGQTLQGTYRLNAENDLEWTLSGQTTKSKANVTATELQLTDDANRTIKYRRK